MCRLRYDLRRVYAVRRRMPHDLPEVRPLRGKEDAAPAEPVHLPLQYRECRCVVAAHGVGGIDLMCIQ